MVQSAKIYDLNGVDIYHLSKTKPSLHFSRQTTSYVYVSTKTKGGKEEVHDNGKLYCYHRHNDKKGRSSNSPFSLKDRHNVKQELRRWKRCYSVIADLTGPLEDGPQHYIPPYRIYRRQLAHQQLVVAHYTWRRYILEARHNVKEELRRWKRCYSVIADLTGPLEDEVGPQYYIPPYRIYRRQVAHQQVVVAQYTWRRYIRSSSIQTPNISKCGQYAHMAV